MNKTALNTLIKQLEHRIELAEKKKQEEDHIVDINKKVTAVEWLKDQLEHFGNKHELTVSWNTLDELIEQAKEMHKQEINDAYKFGISDEYVIGSQRYYNEIFKSE
jgi:N-methylhydantoinase B/oxoprolinase/acetone carboxylase alpha subunit